MSQSITQQTTAPKPESRVEKYGMPGIAARKRFGQLAAEALTRLAERDELAEATQSQERAA
ncbi:hypothetical protein [Pseudoclavibacter sp. VKM Ac-2888]|uniref:hypothetical protein n=1 Tax=Pseudoclavibacter sp. VKM Ac-2888 TaxID=2783830 RepID=UPI00188A3DD9|nr:hypothetical protein [Pseudoclavibacter sp. VKM Ac-2888]MBF4549703.1 hypothetical protein [Pseudoclavibacter sp. VKM Ac-2888]